MRRVRGHRHRMLSMWAALAGSKSVNATADDWSTGRNQGRALPANCIWDGADLLGIWCRRCQVVGESSESVHMEFSHRCSPKLSWISDSYAPLLKLLRRDVSLLACVSHARVECCKHDREVSRILPPMALIPRF
ncbi:hypothetical protein FKP32DRAFT_478764 [Trametes sanguinea]|nr:hypothetical protein FKP32DRAFT_478764 [Trametes sanguinea]